MADARDAVVTLVAGRASGTVCPSEVARVVAAAGPEPQDWRRALPAVHAAVDTLLQEGRVRLSWKGKVLPTRAGPYRIGRAD